MNSITRDLFSKLSIIFPNEELMVRYTKNLSWLSLEKILGYKVSRKEYRSIQSLETNMELDKKWNEIISLSENRLTIKGDAQKLKFNLRAIEKAIKNRYYCAVFYKHSNGDDGFRLIEPYVVGQGYKFRGEISEEHRDDYYLRCFVIKDAKSDGSVNIKRNKSVSVSKDVPYWRMMRVDRIIRFTVIERKFSYYRPLYTGGSDKNMVRVLNYAPISAFIRQNNF